VDILASFLKKRAEFTLCLEALAKHQRGGLPDFSERIHIWMPVRCFYFRHCCLCSRKAGKCLATYIFHLPVLWTTSRDLTWHLYQDRWDMLCFGWLIHPADSLDLHWQAHEVQFISPRIPWKLLKTWLWSWSKGKNQAWAQMKTWTHPQNEDQIFLLCDPTLHRGEVPEVFHFFRKVW